MSGQLRPNLYKDQYKHWRRNWAVDESRFYKYQELIVD